MKNFWKNEKGMSLVVYIGLMAVAVYVSSLAWGSMEKINGQQTMDVTNLFNALFA